VHLRSVQVHRKVPPSEAQLRTLPESRGGDSLGVKSGRRPQKHCTASPLTNCPGDSAEVVEAAVASTSLSGAWVSCYGLAERTVDGHCGLAKSRGSHQWLLERDPAAEASSNAVPCSRTGTGDSAGRRRGPENLLMRSRDSRSLSRLGFDRICQ
jgi:hypothetical protein